MGSVILYQLCVIVSTDLSVCVWADGSCCVWANAQSVYEPIDQGVFG